MSTTSRRLTVAAICFVSLLEGCNSGGDFNLAAKRKNNSQEPVKKESTDRQKQAKPASVAKTETIRLPLIAGQRQRPEKAAQLPEKQAIVPEEPKASTVPSPFLTPVKQQGRQKAPTAVKHPHAKPLNHLATKLITEQAPKADKTPKYRPAFIKKIMAPFKAFKQRKPQRNAQASKHTAPARSVKTPMSLRGGGDPEEEEEEDKPKKKEQIRNHVNLENGQGKEVNIKKASLKDGINKPRAAVQDQQINFVHGGKSKGMTTKMEGVTMKATAKMGNVQQAGIDARKAAYVETKIEKVEHFHKHYHRKTSEESVEPMPTEKSRVDLQDNYREKCSTLKSPYGGKKDKPISIEVATPRLAFQKEKEKEKDEKEKKGGGEKGDLTKRHEDAQKVKTSITPEELFKPREIDGRHKQVGKVLITAHAGMGKTTLCNWMAHRWQKNREQGKRQEFDDLYLLRVRDLKKDKYPEPKHGKLKFALRDVAEVIGRECFPKKALNPELIARIVQQLKSGKTLVILDGWDEKQGANEELLEAIRDSEGGHKLLITSREHGTEQLKQAVDFNVEVQPMSDKHLETYVRESGLDEEEAKDLTAFFKARPALGELARVPVTLQIIRTLWRNDRAVLEKTVNGPAALYQKMTEYLWERYAKKYKRNSQRRRKLQHDSREAAFEILRRVAFLGMDRGEANISQETLREVLSGVGQNFDMEDFLQHSGLLEEAGEGHQFPHLTFQEYFAGQQLAGMLAAKDKHAQQFLNAHKYEGRYGVMLRFTAAAVYEAEGIEGAKKMLTALDKTQEVGGLQHNLLQMRCLDEWLGTAQEDDLAELRETFKEPMENFNKWLEKGLKEKDLQRVVVGAWADLRHVLQKSDFAKIYEKALKDKSEDVRLAAAWDLGELVKVAPQEALPWLEPALKDKNIYVCFSAALALGEAVKFAPQDALPLLETVLKDKDIRFSAAMALKEAVKVAPQDALPLLEPALKDEDLLVRRAAALALGEAVKVAPQDALPLLETALKDKDVRPSAAVAFKEAVKVAPQEALPLLETALKDDNENVRRAAALALGEAVKFAPQDALPLLETALKDKDENACIVAAEALGEAVKFAPQEALPWLETALKDDNEYVRKAAAEALGEAMKVAPDEALPWLELALKDDYEYVRKAAAEALREAVKVAPQEMLPWLETALGDDDEYVHFAAARALGAAVKVAPQEMLPWLETALGDDDKYVRKAAAEALGAALQVAPAKALSWLETALGDENEDVRRAAARALVEAMQVAPAKALLWLETALGDENLFVHFAAAEALQGIPTQPLIDYYLTHSSVARIDTLIKQRLYREKLVIGPLEGGRHTLTFYPDTGEPQQWQVTPQQTDILHTLMQPVNTKVEEDSLEQASEGQLQVPNRNKKRGFFGRLKFWKG